MSIDDLNHEIAARKARAQTEPLRFKPVKALSRADVFGGLSTLERLQNEFLAFAEAQKPAFDALPDTEPCPNHPDMLLAKNFERTVERSRGEGYFVATRDECGACKAEENAAVDRAYWRRRGVPDRVIEARFSNYVADIPEKMAARDRVKAWIKGPCVFLLLLGTPGTGKGHLAMSALRMGTMYREDVSDQPRLVRDGLFITHSDMLNDLRSSYSSHTTADLRKAWRDAPVLVLDEFGLSVGGRDDEQNLYDVLADRYDKSRKTIITSNLTLPEAREKLGVRIVDRMRESCTEVSCRWPSFRSGK